MANSNEQKQETKPLKQKTDVASGKQPQEPNKPHCPQNNLLISTLALFIAIASMVITLCTIQSNDRLQTKLVNKNRLLRAEIAQLRLAQNNNQEQAITKDRDIKQTQDMLQSRLNHLSTQLQSTMDQTLYQNQDWLLLKARYYLELAQINAHWSDDFSASIALLQQADKLLAQLSAPKIFAVRQALAKEIAQLKAISIVDTAGLLSQLDAAQTSVSNLPVQMSITQSEPEAKAETVSPSIWKARLHDSIALLERMVIIRRDDERIKPLMSPLYESLLRESIRLNLQQAQWAIINNNPVVYQLALKQAALSLKRTLNQASPSAAALLKQLSDLQKKNITQEKPVMNLALPLLNQLIDNKELLVVPGNNGGKGEK